MFEYHDPDKGRKHFFDRPPQFWDKVVKGLFLGGISIVFVTLIFKWLGYFD